MRILGLDPGLQHTGWGVIDAAGARLSFVAAGVVNTLAKSPLPERLVQIYDGLREVIDLHQPDEAAVEETFVNRDARATLKLGQARGIALLVPASLGIPVSEYAPNEVKKSVVGAGHAEKDQVKRMVRVLLPRALMTSADSTDALAIAICHAHHRRAHALAKILARS